MRKTNLHKALEKQGNQVSQQDMLLQQAQRILVQSRLSEKNVLDNLKFYNKSFQFLDDDDIEKDRTFSPFQIKKLCKKLRLKFLPSQTSPAEMPYEAILKIKDLNTYYRKDIKHFKIVSTANFFTEKSRGDQAMLFSQTLHGHYYLIHSWGKPLSKWRSLKLYPFRNFESLLGCLLIFSLAEALLLPSNLISTDKRGDYFSLYRIACILHLLILNAGFTIFGLFSFHFSFSENKYDTLDKSRR